MNLVDSSGWIEFIQGGPNADFFSPAITDRRQLIVPSICIFEVYRVLLRVAGANFADDAATNMMHGNVVELSPDLAIDAAQTAHQHKLAMADAIILATAWQFDAVLWTQDKDLAGFTDVKFKAKH